MWQTQVIFLSSHICHVMGENTDQQQDEGERSTRQKCWFAVSLNNFSSQCHLI